MKINAIAGLLTGAIVAGLFASASPWIAVAQAQQVKSLEYRVDNTVREVGTIETASSIELRSNVKGESTILFVAPEGSQVKKGDLLVELDGSALRDSLLAAEIEVHQAKAGLVQADVELESAKVNGEGVLRVLEKQLRAAELARKRALGDGGELACQLAAVESEIAVAKERLQMASALVTRAPGERGGKQVTDLRLMIFEAKEAIKVAEVKKQFLEKHERDHLSALLDLALVESEVKLVRERVSLQKAIRIAEAGRMAAEAELKMAMSKLAQVREELSTCKIIAPRDGLVVYPVAGASRTALTAIEVGATVRERQPIVMLPDLSKLQVKVRVNESRVDRLKVGQPARITVDAFPDRSFKGRLVRVNTVAEQSGWLDSDTKYYTAIVAFDEPTERLRIGMTTLVEIDTGQ